jgi:D-3-phosphoglycerate dehydrogenase / 2-oxoglutarate reductase
MTSLPRPFKVVRTDSEIVMPLVDDTLRRWGGQLVLLPEGMPPWQLAQALADAELLLMCYQRIDAEAIAAAPHLRAIVKYGVGIDAIDIDAARERGVPVVNVPAYAEETVAEGAFALLMALFKRLKPIQQAMQDRGWIWPEPAWLAHDLSGKTLALVGLGRIGRSMARMATAFRMRVLAFDPFVAAGDWPAGVERCAALDPMIGRCDALSLHCVLNAQTRHLIGAAQLARLKPTAYLVNVSRGELIDESALLPVLLQRRIAGAALDVYGQEPLALQGHPLSALVGLDHVLLWPHLTFYTHEAMRRLEEETLARCREALLGEPLTVLSHDPRLRAQTRGVRFG